MALCSSPETMPRAKRWAFGRQYDTTPVHVEPNAAEQPLDMFSMGV